MNILVVHEVSYLKKVVYDYQHLSEGLAARGHRVTVIDYDSDGDGQYAQHVCSRTGQGAVLLEHVPYRNWPVLKYFFGRINYQKMLKQKLQRQEIDVVFLYSVFINGTNTIKLCRQYGIPVVYRLIDIYHKIRKNYLITLPLYLGERFIYQHADAICVLCDNLTDYVKRLTNKQHQPIEVIPHAVDTTQFRPLPRDSELAELYGIQNEDRVIIFIGTLFDFSGLDILLPYFHMLQEAIPTVKLLIVGDGELGGTLKEFVRVHHLERQILLTGFRPYEEVPRFLSLADVALNPFMLNPITYDIIPGKILQYLACAKPTLCSPMPNVQHSFPEFVSGMRYADIEQPEKFINMLTEMLQNIQLLDELSQNAVRFIQKHFTLEKQLASVEQLLFKVCQQKQSS